MAAQTLRKKAVILGASGFIGTNLAQALLVRGYEIVAFSRSHGDGLPPECQSILGDIAAPPPALLDAMSNSIVFHLASSTRPTNSTNGAHAELVQDVGATLRLLETTREIACRWIFASSGGTVYGQPQTELIAEDHPTNPISSYGVAKLAMERYFELYRMMHGTDYVIARIANPYGPFQSPTKGQGLVATLFDRISKGVPIEIWGDGENVRDYIYIADVIDALIALAEHGKSGHTYNIGSGKGVSVNELVRTISDLLDIPPELRHTPARGIDVRRNQLDISRIGRDVRWRPNVPLEDGIRLTGEWLQLDGGRHPEAVRGTRHE